MQQGPDAVVDQVAEAQCVESERFEAAVDGLGGSVRCPVVEEGEHIVTAAVQGAAEGGQLLEPGRRDHLHNDHYQPDERCIGLGVQALSRIALDILA